MARKAVRQRRVLGVSIGLAVVLLAPSSALGAVTVSTFNDRMSVTSDAAADTITLGGDPSVPGGQGTASAVGIALAPPDPRCTDSGDTVTCTGTDVAPFDTFSAVAAGGDDDVTIATAQFWGAFGGDGDDTLTGSDSGIEILAGEAGNDSLYSRGGGSDQATQGFLGGGAGDDLVQGGPDGQYLQGDEGTDQVLGDGGPDTVTGGAGDGDVVDGGAGDDTFYEFGDWGTGDSLGGGGGSDEIVFDGGGIGGEPPDSFAVNLATGQSSRTNNAGGNKDSLSDIEDVFTGDGADSLTGDGGPNNLISSDGNDTVVGGGGSDSLFGGTGDDSMQDRDGVRDRVDCGPGNDQALLDQIDAASSCEPPQAPGTPIGPAAPGTPTARDVAPPRCTIAGLESRQKRKAFFKGVRFRLRCNERYRVEARLFVRVRRIRGGRVITSRAGDLVLGERRLGLAGGRRIVRLTAAKSLRSRLGRRFTARVKIDTFDALGNRRTTFRRIRVR